MNMNNGSGMIGRQRPVLAYSCPQCGGQAVMQREEGPRQLLDWEDVLWKELVFACTQCQWTQVVGRVPLKSSGGG